ncbi:hypothetical protein RvY_07971 [Ramazzottius varieornatus]|uniref:Uncharacterized protein n=1 Tax=Ramazzottius varieornatus TaxID=947166 RepID=A0A1D1V499_RAMVA|nr:hypothetical protein RvY_07971 [Ramazzottius varieornatus]
MFSRSETVAGSTVRHPLTTAFDRASSSSSSGNTNESSPIAPARNKRISRPSLSGSRTSLSDAQKSLRASHDVEESQLAEPGEIVTGESQNGSLGLTDAEKYRELNAADLIVVIDMQQKLLDRLNLENREYAAQARESTESFAALLASNERLQARERMRTTISVLDQILASDVSPGTITENLGPTSESVLHVRDTLTAQVEQLKAQLQLKDHEVSRVKEKFEFTQSNLQDKTEQLELLEAKATVVPSAKYQVELELLTDSLKRQLARCKAEEAEHRLQITRLAEKCASVECENKHMKEALSRSADEREVMRIDFERERQSVEARLRTEDSNLVSALKVQVVNVEDRIKGLQEELQVLSKKESFERTARHAAEMNLQNAQQNLRSRQEISEGIIQQLRNELSEKKLELTLANTKHTTELEQARTELHSYTTRWKMGEQRMAKLRQRLHEAENGWLAVERENAQLLAKLSGQMDSSADRVNQPQTTAVIDALNKELASLRETHENNLTTTRQLTAFVHSQSVLIDRFKEECTRLVQHAENEHERCRRHVNQARTFGQEVAQKYTEAVNLNKNLLTELQNVGLPLTHSMNNL